MREPTGDPAVDGVVELLDDVDDCDIDEQPAIFDEVHRRLSDVLRVGEPAQAGGDED